MRYGSTSHHLWTFGSTQLKPNNGPEFTTIFPCGDGNHKSLGVGVQPVKFKKIERPNVGALSELLDTLSYAFGIYWGHFEKYTGVFYKDTQTNRFTGFSNVHGFIVQGDFFGENVTVHHRIRDKKIRMTLHFGKKGLSIPAKIATIQDHENIAPHLANKGKNWTDYLMTRLTDDRIPMIVKVYMERFIVSRF